MANNWQILVVDDEPDVYAVTRIALRRRTHAGRGFTLTRARSCAQAKKLLGKPGGQVFDVVVTDGVMETMTAGFDLGGFIRRDAHLSVPIILRSGIYSEPYVRKNYPGIFTVVVAKPDVTVDVLFEAIQACLMCDSQARSVPAVA